MQQEETSQRGTDEEMNMVSASIEKLQDYNVNAADINKLKNAGICTVKGLLMATKKELTNIKGISDQKIDKMIEAAEKIEGLGFSKASDVLVKREHIRKITTGSRNLDNLLQGGIESMAITEAFGEFRTGKTQLSHTLCVTAQLPKENGGGHGKVIYIDTENTFRPERIKEIAKRFEVDENEILDNILVARAYTVDHLNQLLMFAASKMYDDDYALLIVDSIMAPFRVDYTGRGELSERQQVLGKTLSRLLKIAEQFNVAVFMTNQVMADPGGSSAFACDPRKPVGGNIIAHASTTRLYFKKGKGEQRICKIYDSPLVAETECNFAISLGGIVDPE